MSIIGVPEVQQRLNRIISQMILEAEKAAMLTQEQIVMKAKNDAPIGTPQSTGIPNYIISESYKRSIRRLSPTKTSDVFTAPVVAGGEIINPNTGRPVDYSIQLEYGWSNQAPQGVLVPSMVAQRKFLQDEIRKGIRRVR